MVMLSSAVSLMAAGILNLVNSLAVAYSASSRESSPTMGATRRSRLILTGLFAALAAVFLFDLLVDPRGASRGGQFIRCPPCTGASRRSG